MLGSFSSRDSSLIGIDISAASVKLLCLDRQCGIYHVKHYDSLPLPPGTIVENNVKDIAALAATIKELVKITGINNKNAAIAMPDSAVMTKVIQVGKDLKQADIEAQIMVEAEYYIPHPLEDLSLDFAILPAQENHSETVDVLLVASHTINVASRVTALKNGGINVVVVDVATYAIERVYPLISHRILESIRNKTVAIVDIGSHTTSLRILHHQTSIFTRTELLGDQQLSDDIQKHYGLTEAEVDLMQRQQPWPQDFACVVQSFKQSLVLYLRRALQFFFSANPATDIHHVFLAGRIAFLPGLAIFIAEQISIAVTVANPFSDMSVDPCVNQTLLTHDAPALLVCCGLALRRFEH